MFIQAIQTAPAWKQLRLNIEQTYLIKQAQWWQTLCSKQHLWDTQASSNAALCDVITIKTHYFTDWLRIKHELTESNHTASLLPPPATSLVPRTRPSSGCLFPSCLWWVESHVYTHACRWRLIARHYVVNVKLRRDNRSVHRCEHVAQVWRRKCSW